MKIKKNITTARHRLLIRWCLAVLISIYFRSSTYSQVNTSQNTCYGAEVRYGVDIYENIGYGTFGSIYTWRVLDRRFSGSIDNLYANRTNQIIINWKNTPAGVYELSVIEETLNCLGTEQRVTVTILPPLPDPNLSNKSICIDPVSKRLITPATLDSKITEQNYRFDWKHNKVSLPYNTPKITVSEIGNYSLVLTNLDTGCSITDVATVDYSSKSNSVIQISNMFQNSQDVTVALVNGLGSYEYSINQIDYQESNAFRVTEPGTYRLIVRDKKGCKPEYINAVIIFYTQYFTPNGDGAGEFWKINGLLPEMQPLIYIYDRYGKLLKQLTINDEGWNGTLNGTELPSDDYWFTIEFINSQGQPDTFKSHFTLKR